jgi:hypothetical protein
VVKQLASLHVDCVYVCSQSDDQLIAELQHINVASNDFEVASADGGSDASVYQWPAPSEQAASQRTEIHEVDRGIRLVPARYFKFVQV